MPSGEKFKKVPHDINEPEKWLSSYSSDISDTVLITATFRFVIFGVMFTYVTLMCLWLWTKRNGHKTVSGTLAIMRNNIV